MLFTDSLHPNVHLPTYDRSALRTRMVHIGFGAFHRAHQAVCTDRLAAQGSDWGYCEVNLNSGEAIHALRQQQLCYSVAEMADDRMDLRVIGVITQVLHGESDGTGAVLAALCQPEVAIVSMTVTEKGYCHHPASGELDLQHPAIIRDLAHPDSPTSVPGIILAAIRLRRQRGLLPFSVMSCDNMPENGRVTKRIIIRLAQQQDPELAAWIESSVTFPSTMVDRIVPAMTEETHRLLTAQLGCDDPAGVACEPFFQWVIEDNFVSGRPRWEQAGAELVNDVVPWEEMKLRMLNGSHSFLAYLGNLAGYEHISDCMDDDRFLRAARHLMIAEQAPTLRTPGVDLQVYADSLIARYRNRAIKHRTAQIASDGSQKLPQRWLESIRWHLQRGSRFDLLALGVAGWIHYVSKTCERGGATAIGDPLRDALAKRVTESRDGDARVSALLALEPVFAADLPTQAAFVNRVNHFYDQLRAHGAKTTVHRWVDTHL